MPERFTSWQYNVVDKYKACTKDEIRDDLAKRAHPFGIFVSHILGDFNLSCVVRSANGFNAEKVFYSGRKRWDKRGACGVYHYTPLNYLASHDDIVALKDEYSFVALENTNKTHMLHEFDWNLPKKPLLILGEEGAGIPQEILDLCDYTVEIASFGCVRSYNLAVAASIAMHDLVTKKYL